MRSFSALSARFGAYSREFQFFGLAAIVFANAGCGGDAPKTEAQIEQNSKVDSMLKEGKSLSQIRAAVKGEPDPKAQAGKKKAPGKR
jgi:hypothetical protein